MTPPKKKTNELTMSLFIYFGRIKREEKKNTILNIYNRKKYKENTEGNKKVGSNCSIDLRPEQRRRRFDCTP